MKWLLTRPPVPRLQARFLDWQAQRALSCRPGHWQDTGSAVTAGQPWVALLHGLAAGAHMDRHWLTRLRREGGLQVQLYSHHHPLSALVADAQAAHRRGQAVVLFGFSQGGFMALRLARALAAAQVPVRLLWMVAAGGLGRWYPAQWGFEPRKIPANVAEAVHVYAHGDVLGTDRHRLSNPIRAAHPATQIRNIELPRGVSHVGLSATHPERTDARVWREVVEGFLRRIEALRSDGPPTH